VRASESREWHELFSWSWRLRSLNGRRCGLGEDVTPPRKLARVTAPGHQPEGRAAKLEIGRESPNLHNPQGLIG